MCFKTKEKNWHILVDVPYSRESGMNGYPSPYSRTETIEVTLAGIQSKHQCATKEEAAKWAADKIKEGETFWIAQMTTKVTAHRPAPAITVEELN